MTRTTIAVATALLATLTLLTGLAAAQDATPTSTPTGNGTDAIPDGEQIDRNTVLVEADYHPGSRDATITLYSHSLQQVTITDVSPYMDGGAMEQRTTTLRPDQETTIRIPVDPSQNGFVGVSVATPSTLYAVPLERPGVDLSAPAPNDLMALFLGAVAPIGSARMIEWWSARKRSQGVARIDG